MAIFRLLDDCLSSFMVAASVGLLGLVSLDVVWGLESAILD